MKTCSKCKKLLPYQSFYRSRTQAGGYQAYCRSCNLKNLNERYPTWDVIARRAKSRQYLLKRLYKLTPEEYLRLLKKQKGVCAICKRPETQQSSHRGPKDHLPVDHNHKTGRVRGLLCSECNIGLSKFDDNLEILGNAYSYLLEDKRIIKEMHEEERNG